MPPLPPEPEPEPELMPAVLEVPNLDPEDVPAQFPQSEHVQHDSIRGETILVRETDGLAQAPTQPKPGRLVLEPVQAQGDAAQLQRHIDEIDANDDFPAASPNRIPPVSYLSSTKYRRELATAWLATALVVAGVVYASMLMHAAAAAMGLISDGRDNLPPWPVQTVEECDIQISNADSTSLPFIFNSWLDNAIGLAPIYLRNALLTAICVKAIAKVAGFDAKEQKKQKQKKKKASGRRSTVASMRSSHAALLATILTDDRLGSSEEFAAAMAKRDWEREEEHKRELELARSEGAFGLIRLLLTGHGLKPVPRIKAGWAAITDDASDQSTWHEARDSLGLTVRQAAWVSVAKLLLWHWSQPLGE